MGGEPGNEAIIVIDSAIYGSKQTEGEIRASINELINPRKPVHDLSVKLSPCLPLAALHGRLNGYNLLQHL